MAAGLALGSGAGCSFLDFPAPEHELAAATGGAAATDGAAATGGTATTGGTAAKGGATPTGGTPGMAGMGGVSGDSGGGSSGNAAGAAARCEAPPAPVRVTSCSFDSRDVPSCYDAPQATGAEPELLDDFDDCDTCIRAVAGRRGFWEGFMISSDTSLESLFAASIEGEPTRPSPSLHLEHALDDEFYAYGVTTPLNGSDECDSAGVDLSMYSGVAFSAKNGSGAKMTLLISDLWTTSDAAYQTSLVYTLPLRAGWSEYRVSWGDFVRGDEQDPTPADPSSFKSINIAGATGTRERIDFWLDDLRFF
jgi:hypothetical protein